MAPATAVDVGGFGITKPVSPSTTASADAPAVAGHRRDRRPPPPRGSTIPNPSCSRPPQRDRQQQREHVGAGVQARQVRRRAPGRAGGPAHRSRGSGRSRRGRSRPLPAMATVSCGCRPDRASRAAASMSVSMPLRGTSRLTLSTSGPGAGQAEAGPGAGPLDRAPAGRTGPCPRRAGSGRSAGAWRLTRRASASG